MYKLFFSSPILLFFITNHLLSFVFFFRISIVVFSLVFFSASLSFMHLFWFLCRLSSRNHSIVVVELLNEGMAGGESVFFCVIYIVVQGICLNLTNDTSFVSHIFVIPNVLQATWNVVTPSPFAAASFAMNPSVDVWCLFFISVLDSMYGNVECCDYFLLRAFLKHLSPRWCEHNTVSPILMPCINHKVEQWISQYILFFRRKFLHECILFIFLCFIIFLWAIEK